VDGTVDGMLDGNLDGTTELGGREGLLLDGHELGNLLVGEVDGKTVGEEDGEIDGLRVGGELG